MTFTLPTDAAPSARLIEVALPIREVSAEAVRQKSPQRGHISTLHLWWARRPLAAARAVVFASLVPDPDDPSCPEEFRGAVRRLLKDNVPHALKSYTRGREHVRDDDPYRPYEGVADTLRNRLLAFIAKWSPETIAFEAGKSSRRPKPPEFLDDRSLVKWETSDPENPQGQEVLRVASELVQAAYGRRRPCVLDPFGGGGAIPLEAGRLGADPIANDYNPVAYLILRATCEFPSTYGKPGRRLVALEEFGQPVMREVPVTNQLTHDFEQWARSILENARGRIGQFYPPGADGLPIVGYMWARTAPCSNPTCGGQIPLLKTLSVCQKPGKHVALSLAIDKSRKTVRISISRQPTAIHSEGTMLSRGDVRCPYCDQVTPVAQLRAAGIAGLMGERMVAVIVEGAEGKDYRAVEQTDLAAYEAAQAIVSDRPGELILPEITADDTDDPSNSTGIRVHLYGMTSWGSLFNDRQLVVMNTFVSAARDALTQLELQVHDPAYRVAIGIYIGLWVSRIAQRTSNVGIWHKTEEKLEHPFGRQAIPMTWDYPEGNPLSDSSGGAEGAIDLMVRVMRRERMCRPTTVLRGDATALRLDDGSADVVVTDPPYFDAIAYADLSDYFYVWIRRIIGDVVPDIMATPLTPKSGETTALKHRHGGDPERADAHFRTQLARSLAEAHRVAGSRGIVSIMFAHQSTKAWSALVHAIFGAGLTVDATWPIDTELTSALKATKSALASSVTVVCRPRVVGSAGAFKEVRREVEVVVADSVKRFWTYGIRGADLLVACYGPAVGVFGKYERIERADGSVVNVAELLDLARRAALDAIAGEFRGDALSTLYFVWTTLYGPGEQSWDDARLVVQIGGDADATIDMASRHGIFVVDGSACRLALLADRPSQRLGLDKDPPLIDALHHAMLLWKEEQRADLVGYLATRELLEDGPIWKLAQALFEVLPRDLEDWKLVSALLTERQTLRTEGKKAAAQREIGLFDRPT